MVIPEDVEAAIRRSVTGHLATQLSAHGLLLDSRRTETVGAEVAALGGRLLSEVLRKCYEMAGDEVAFEFDSEQTAARLQGALAFGAATATVLAPAPPTDEVALLCALFNLGIGLVDGVCDADAGTGEQLLQLVQETDLAQAAAERRQPGWLRATVPRRLADATVSFTVDVVEAFFETLHAVYPGAAEAVRRRHVGAQLDDALDAERRSVARSSVVAPVGELLDASRRTSVLPFHIIGTLAGCEFAAPEPAAATLLGEAMWRIDDLVDLGQDARSGALNSVLLKAAVGSDGGAPTALDGLLASPHIACAAAEAAASLSAGLELAAGNDRLRAGPLLYFVQLYAGIPPVEVA